MRCLTHSVIPAKGGCRGWFPARDTSPSRSYLRSRPGLLSAGDDLSRERGSEKLVEITSRRCHLKFSRTVIVLLLARVLLIFSDSRAEPLFRQVDVFLKGEQGVHTYRIPGMVVTSKGTVLAFCEARKDSSGDQTPTDMVLKRSEDGGASWQPLQVVVKGRGLEAIMNPTPVVNRRDGSVLLLCNRFPDVNSQFKPGAVRQLVLKSVDDGKTWSAPVDISGQVSDTSAGASLCVGPGMGIQTRTGRLVVPFWHHEGGGEPDLLDSVIYSDDDGKRWKRGATVSGFGDESQVVELADGSLLFSIRSTRDCAGDRGHRRTKVAFSRDGGISWSQASLDDALISPCCQASILRYSLKREGADKNRLLFSNPAHISKRVNMTVRVSYDEGKSWPVARSVYEGPSAYSCLGVLSDGTIGVLFETGESHAYEKIAFARLNLEWLTHGRDQPQKSARQGKQTLATEKR